MHLDLELGQLWNQHSQLLSTSTVPGWRASEFLNHRHMTPACLCINTTWTHRVSCPDLTCAQQIATVPLTLSYSKVSRHLCDQQTLTPVFSLLQHTEGPALHPANSHSYCYSPGDPSSLSSQSWACTGSQFSPSRHSSAGLQAPQERCFSVKGFVRHWTASTHSPSQHSAGTWS